MDFIEEIFKETLIICDNNDKQKILKRNKLINIKVMNMKEFISKFCFDYDDASILYLMNNYDLSY